MRCILSDAKAYNILFKKEEIEKSLSDKKQNDVNEEKEAKVENDKKQDIINRSKKVQTIINNESLKNRGMFQEYFN